MKNISFSRYMFAIVIIGITVYIVQERDERAAWYYVGVLAMGFLLVNQAEVNKFLNYAQSGSGSNSGSTTPPEFPDKKTPPKEKPLPI